MEGQGRPARAGPRGRGGRRDRNPGAEWKRQVDAHPDPRDAAHARLRHGDGLRLGRRRTAAVGAAPRQSRISRSRLLQRAEPVGEHALRRASLRRRSRRHSPAGDGDPREAWSAPRHGGPADETAVARTAAEGRHRAQLPHRPLAALDGRADHRARSPLEERGPVAAVHAPRRARGHGPALHARHGRGRRALRPRADDGRWPRARGRQPG